MDEIEPPFLQMNCDINDVRLLYKAVEFYLDNYPESEPIETLPNRLQHLKQFKKTLYSMLLEYNFHKE
jgi:hypothetical protein